MSQSMPLYLKSVLSSEPSFSNKTQSIAVVTGTLPIGGRNSTLQETIRNPHVAPTSSVAAQ